jgi:hypothetical protein
MKHVGKICLFVAAVAVYYFCGGFASPRERGMVRFFDAVDLTFAVGLIGAVWGGNTRIGILQPTSMRGIFIGLGCIAVIGALVVTIATRQDRKPPVYSPFPSESRHACVVRTYV